MNFWFEGQSRVKLWFLHSFLRRGRADLEAETVVARFDDAAVMGEAIEHGRRHLGVAENARSFSKA